MYLTELLAMYFSVLFFQDLIAKIAPTWMNVSLKMKEDPETDKAFGWVLEMYVSYHVTD